VSTDSDEAAATANAFAEQFIIYRRNMARALVDEARSVIKSQLELLGTDQLESDYGLMLQEKYETLRVLEAMQDGDFRLIGQAVAPDVPFTPRTRLNLIVALVVGLVLGVGFAFLIDHLDKRIKDVGALEEELGVPVLTVVPSVGGRWRSGKKGERSAHPIGFSTHPSLLEPFRTLRSSLQYFSVEKKHPVWLITSGLPSEGKTVTTVNLGLSLALSGKRVIVLEADLRRPMVPAYLEMDNQIGLSSVLTGTKALAEVLQLVKTNQLLPPGDRRLEGGEDCRLLQRNLYVMPSGPLPPNPAELLGSDRMVTLIRELAVMADCLLIDTPPLLAVSDALVLAPHADGIILAARLNSTNREEAREVRTILERVGARVIGVVAGGARQSPSYYRKRGYEDHSGHYGYGAE